MKNLLYTALKFSFVLGAVLFTVIYIANQWQEIVAHLEHVDWRNVGVAGVLFIIGMTLLPLGVILSFQFMRFEVSIAAIYHAYALSQIAKYLPGSIWALPGRIFLYNRLSIPASVGVSNLISELILLIAGATFIAVVGLGQRMVELQMLMALVFVATVIYVLMIKLLHNKSSLLSRISLPRRLKQFLTEFDWPFSFDQSVVLFGFYAIVWVVFGFAFQYLLIAVAIPSNEIFYFAGLFAAAWTLGFVFPLTPGGIGIREAVLVSGLSILMQNPLPVVVAALSRILWVIAELFSLGFASAMRFVANKHVKHLKGFHQKAL